MHETASTSGETYGGKSVNQVIRNYEKICQNLGLEDNIGIVTGNWGCGAFGGDPELKTIIQWLAASQVIVSSAVKKERKQRSSFFFPLFLKNVVYGIGWNSSILIYILLTEYTLCTSF